MWTTWGAPFAIILPGLPEPVLRSFFTPVLLVPIFGIVVFLVSQKRPDIDMSLSLPSLRRLRLVDDGNEPVPITPEIKNHATIHVIRVFVDVPHLLKIMPSGGINDGLPILDFTSRVLEGLGQGFQRPSNSCTHLFTQTARKRIMPDGGENSQ